MKQAESTVVLPPIVRERFLVEAFQLVDHLLRPGTDWRKKSKWRSPVPLRYNEDYVSA